MSYAGQITLENSDLQIPCLKSFLDKIGDMISSHHHKDANLNSTQSEMINTDEEEEVMEPGSIINHDNSVQDMSSSEVIITDEEEEVMEPGSIINHDNSVEEELIELTVDNEQEDMVVIPSDEEEEILEPTPDLSVTFPTIIDDHNKDLWEPSGFFQDDKLDNALSPVRVGSFTALLAAIMLGGLTVLGNTQAAEAEATYALLGAAFGTKIVQKVSK
jgi:hypothetical protein